MIKIIFIIYKKYKDEVVMCLGEPIHFEREWL